MKLNLLVVTLMALVWVAVISAPQTLAQTPPVGPPRPPSAGTKLVGGLLSPRGMKIGPDSMIYVAEAGTAGAIAAGTGDNASKSGFTGRISKVDPATGVRTTVADKLPSNGEGEGGANLGPADVAFIGSQLYYVQTHGGTAFGFPATTPTGIYKVNSNGTVTLFADLGAFNVANPSASVKSSAASDVEPGGNPYTMTVRNGDFYVVDGNQNSIVKVTGGTNPVITRFSDFPTDITTTGIAYSGSGPFYVSTLGGFPFAPEDGRVYQVGFPSGSQSQVASGFSSLTNIAYGPGDNLYAVQFGDQATNPNGPPWVLGSGKILKVDLASGKLTPIVAGFAFPTSAVFSGDTAYVTNGGITIPGFIDGAIWKIDGFSAITPIPQAPPPPPTSAPVAVATATPKAGTGVISAPNTGTGGAAGSSDGWLGTMLALSAVGAVAVFAATRLIWKRGE